MRPFTSTRSAGRALAALGAAVFVVTGVAGVHACEPCGTTLDLRHSLEKADLVVVAKRPAVPKQPENPANGPACDELLVEGVLKGEFEGERLRVRSWYGMCPYGIILNEGTYVVLLRKAVSHEYDLARYDSECGQALKRKPELYSAVEEGCAVRHLAVESGSVEAEGVKLTLEEFKGKYGLRPAAAETPRDLFGAWSGGSFGAGLFAPAVFLEVTK